MITFLKRLFSKFQPPPAPFHIGQRVLCTSTSEYNHHTEGEVYTIRSMYLSTDRTFWFVRLEEIPASSSAEHYVAIQ